ncbi:MAG TPA: AAA family ATPase, partial [Acidimicrobiales bacterium]|nr:AAA family ATPase [Acidimicrobiales bacterium]
MGSTETVSILFTDMVGSTELSQRLTPTAVDQWRQRHFSELRRALAAHQGREVKNLGDGLMVAFGTASAAVACAVAIQQMVERDNRRADHPVGVRVALSGGEVTAEDGDYFGDPVVEAARLCSLCESGQILVSDTVRSMAGRRSPHPFTALGNRELKGMPEPVPVFEVRWEPLASTSGTPLPDRLQGPGPAGPGFLGRRPEQEMLLQALKETLDGTPHTVLVCGEPGIGKTALCRQVACRAQETGAWVLYGRCDEDLGVSYQPFAEALSHLVAHADEAILRDHVEDHGGALLGLLPALAKRLPAVAPPRSGDLDAERLQLFNAAVELLAGAASGSGLLLVLDDLHWADRASLQLLRHLVGAGPAHVMVLGTYRDSELAAGAPLSDTLASLRREGTAARVDLGGFDDPEVVELLERMAGHEIDEDGLELARALRRETDGNPFFTIEMLRHLGESGLVRRDEHGRWEAAQIVYGRGLPQSVREVVGQRVDRLGEETRRVLSHAAVIGRDFDLDLLARVANLDDERVLDVIDGAAAAGVVNEVEGAVERFSFAHALIQTTLYQDLGHTRRSRLHRRIAETLEELPDDRRRERAGELANHFLAATKAENATKALAYCKLAGEQALARLAPGDAMGWFAKASDLYDQVEPDEELRCDILIGWGTAMRQTGDPTYRETLLEATARAEGLGDTERMVTSVLLNGRGLLGGGTAGHVDEERIVVIEAALRAVGDGASASRALLLAALSAELMFTPERWSSPAREAIDIARRLDDPRTFLRVTSSVHSVAVPDNLEDRLDDLTRAVAIAEELDDLMVLCHGGANLALAHLQACDRAGFDASLGVSTRAAEHLGHHLERWNALSLSAMGAWVAGDLEEAERCFTAALAVGSGTVPEAMAVYGSQLLVTRLAQGR